MSGPTAGTCGASSWGAQWYLDDPDATNGWIVQHVVLNYDVRDATNNPVPGRASIAPAWWNFWEAWQVRSGAVYVGMTATPHSADTYADDSMGDGTKGTITTRATADYYPDLALPSGFTVRNASPAWSLPITSSDPGLTGGTGSIPHDATATWDCTAGSADRATHLSTN